MKPILQNNEVVKYLQLWFTRSGRTLDEGSFELGRMSVALVLESQARISEEFGSLAFAGLHHELIANALRDTLLSLGMSDDVLDAYDSVVIMKAADQPRFMRADDDESPYDPASSSQPSVQQRSMPLLQEHLELHRGRSEVDSPQAERRAGPSSST